MHHDGLKKNGGSAPFKAAVPGVTFHKQGNRRKSFGEILVTSDGRLWPKTTFKDTRVGTCRCCVWHLLSLSLSPQDMVIKYYTSPCWFVVVAKTHWLRLRERGRGTSYIEFSGCFNKVWPELYSNWWQIDLSLSLETSYHYQIMHSKLHCLGILFV